MPRFDGPPEDSSVPGEVDLDERSEDELPGDLASGLVVEAPDAFPDDPSVDEDEGPGEPEDEPPGALPIELEPMPPDVEPAEPPDDAPPEEPPPDEPPPDEPPPDWAKAGPEAAMAIRRAPVSNERINFLPRMSSGPRSTFQARQGLQAARVLTPRLPEPRQACRPRPQGRRPAEGQGRKASFAPGRRPRPRARAQASAPGSPRAPSR